MHVVGILHCGLGEPIGTSRRTADRRSIAKTVLAVAAAVHQRYGRLPWRATTSTTGLVSTWQLLYGQRTIALGSTRGYLVIAVFFRFPSYKECQVSP